MRGLYIHIPFCVKKCRYCDFISYCGQSTEHENYVNAVIDEMKEYSGEKIDTIFIGGGTPTTLSSQQMEKLCRGVFENFKVSEDYEFTTEANPGTIDEQKAKILLNCGINRISIGVQSFNDDELKILGRIHDAKTAYDTVIMLNKSGFKNISIDLMTALPSQNMEKLKHSLETAAALPLTHISAYSLIIEEGTPMYDDYSKGRLVLPDEDSDREMYAFTNEFLHKHGFNRYEISNYAKSGYESRHNIKYWECEEYYGVGAAAHSYIKGRRYYNTKNLPQYISGNYHSSDITTLTKNDMISEFIIMGMRMDKGISCDEFKMRFGCEIEDIFKHELDKFVKAGFIIHKDGNYCFSDKGRNVSNSILCEFVEICE